MSGKKKCEVCRKDYKENGICKDCHKQCNTSQIVVNELLCYVSNYIKKSSLGQLKLALGSFYNEEAVNNAKLALIECAKKLEIEVSEVEQTRHRSIARSAKEAELDDIIKLFQEVIRPTVQVEVNFYAADVSQLPPAAPEEGGSMMSFFELMADQKRQMLQLQQSMATLQSQVAQNTSRLNTGESTGNKSYAGMLSSMPAAGPSRAPPGRVYRAEPERNNPSISIDTLRQALGQIEDGDDEPFRLIQGDGKRPNKGYNRSTGASAGPTRSKVKTGAADKTGSLFAGPEKFHVQLTNVSPQITEERIRTYIEEQNDEVKLVEIKETTTEGWETKRFLVTFDMSNFETVMDNNFWPQGIYYKQWFVRVNQNRQPGTFINKNG